MRTTKVILLYFLVMILTFTGCKQENQTIDLAVCGSYAVPGMFCSELKGASFSCKVLETDSFNRIMFSYTTQNIISKEKETALVICQSIDSENVYFYEDKCYLIGNWSEEDVLNLKIKNDWNHELNLEKSAHRKNYVSLDMYIIPEKQSDFSELMNAVCNYYGIAETQITEFCLMDSYNGSEMYYLEFERASAVEQYCIIFDETSEMRGLSIAEPDIFYSQIGAFKAENG